MPRKKLADAESLSEEELVSLLLRKTQQNFALFYTHKRTFVFDIALKLVNNFEIAGDITQDVFKKIWGTCCRYDPAKAKIDTWLSVITKRKVIDFFRREECHSGLLTSKVRDYFELIYELTPETYCRADSVMIFGLFDQVLNPEEALCFKMHYFEGLSQSEIAEKAQKPLGSVKSSLLRGLVKLQRAYREQTWLFADLI